MITCGVAWFFIHWSCNDIWISPKSHAWSCFSGAGVPLSQIISHMLYFLYSRPLLGRIRWRYPPVFLTESFRDCTNSILMGFALEKVMGLDSWHWHWNAVKSVFWNGRSILITPPRLMVNHQLFRIILRVVYWCGSDIIAQPCDLSTREIHRVPDTGRALIQPYSAGTPNAKLPGPLCWQGVISTVPALKFAHLGDFYNCSCDCNLHWLHTISSFLPQVADDFPQVSVVDERASRVPAPKHAKCNCLFTCM